MRSVKVFMGMTFLCLLLPAVGMAQDKAPEKLGKVVFPTSCDSKVQPRFERAVALLHSFSWQEGEKAFREVLEKDPNCAIATWGIARYSDRQYLRCRTDAGRSTKSQGSHCAWARNRPQNRARAILHRGGRRIL